MLNKYVYKKDTKDRLLEFSEELKAEVKILKKVDLKIM